MNYSLKLLLAPFFWALSSMPLDSLLALGPRSKATRRRSSFTFNEDGVLSPLASLAAAGRRSLTRSNSFSGITSFKSDSDVKKTEKRQTIHASAAINSLALERHTQRCHTDPGRSVQLVFHGPYGGEETSTGPSRAPSLIDMGFSVPPLAPMPPPVSHSLDPEKESPRMSRDTTLTPNTALSSLDSSNQGSRAVRFRQTITEVEVTTPYSIVYDGIKPMCFDFDRWGRKIYHFFPNEDDPGMEQVDSDED